MRIDVSTPSTDWEWPCSLGKQPLLNLVASLPEDQAHFVDLEAKRREVSATVLVGYRSIRIDADHLTIRQKVYRLRDPLVHDVKIVVRRKKVQELCEERRSKTGHVARTSQGSWQKQIVGTCTSKSASP